tara:strand:+ start:8553 stop:9146 length:594 start_codon:yes stop_codon:yes gene_type:complete
MTTVNLDKLSCLAEIFTRLSKNGEHINRASKPLLWANLEQERDAYETLFSSLGYDLRVDSRGFAWFHNTESSTSSNQNTRRLALFFMVIFEFQGDAGNPLRRFTDWRIDRELLDEAYSQHKEVLAAEGISLDDFADIAKTAERFGFMAEDAGAYYLLPAVYRYLDHFEALAAGIDDDFGLGDEGSALDNDKEEVHES